MTATDIVTPIIHLNGTSKSALLEARERFYHSLNDAAAALAEMGPNGRDYYPEPGRMEAARGQHDRRMSVLRSLMKEIERECELIEEQTR